VTDGDEARMICILPDAVAHIAARHADGHVVYVHCNAGLNRAPTVAMAYLHACEGRSLDDAIGFLTARRPCVPFRGALERVYRSGSLPPRDP
jgi:protein-tyrosine phosphatase